MDPQALARLVEQAKQDPQFFHDLVFNTERVLANLDYLDRNTKGALVALSPEEAIAVLTGNIVAECGNTCSSSCENTCGGSCGYTTNLEDRFTYDPRVFPSNPRFFRRIR